jgi:hypothetical protein
MESHIDDPRTDPADAPMSAERMQVRFGTMTPQVIRFLARLSRLPIGTWSQIARSVPTDQPYVQLADAPPLDEAHEDAAAELVAARARLHAIMDGLPGPSARADRDVRAFSNIAQGMVDEAVLTRMHRVALTAVLAIVAQPQLSESDFALLYSPFATLIPVEELDPAA